jgi:ferritin
VISQRIEEAFNGQLNAELYSAYLYLSMAAYFQSINLPGFANWMRVQEQEERVHALGFYDYIISRQGRVKLLPIEGPATEWQSPLDMFETAYRHEQKVTGLINNLVNLALDERDHAANIFLQWYVNEQVEEEANTNDVAQKIKLMGGTGNSLFLIDRELATRVFVLPSIALRSGAKGTTTAAP